MADPYRFGGPIPESVQRMKKRREFRASSLFDWVKQARRGRAAEEALTSGISESKRSAQIVALPSPRAQCLPSGTNTPPRKRS